MSTQPILYLGATAKVIADGTVDLNTASIINATSITATTFTGALTGTATNTSGINTISDNTNNSCYIPFTKSTAGNSRPLYVDDTSGPLTYNPSTSTLSATTLLATTVSATNINGILNGNVANASTVASNSSGALTITNGSAQALTINSIQGSTNIQSNGTTIATVSSTGLAMATGTTVTAPLFSGIIDTGGLVYLQTVSANITGSASAVNFNLANIFNSTYKNYRIVLSPSTQLSFGAYPAYSLYAFLGTSVPTVGILGGFEVTSSSTSTVVAIYSSQTFATTPLVIAVSQSINHQNVIEIENVGYAYTQSQQVGIKCKSFYGNPGVTGFSDRSITCGGLSGCLITGLTLQQSSISSGNNMVLSATVYGYK